MSEEKKIEAAPEVKTAEAGGDQPAAAEKAAGKPFSSILGRKIGMTQIYDKDGKIVPVTVIEAGPCVVVQKKSKDKDGYQALQLGFGRGKNMNKPISGHLKRSNPAVAPKFLRESKDASVEAWNVGEEIRVDVFKPGDIVNVTGTSIGKGFAGTVKRWHFGRGPMTHGSKSHRLVGSIGAGTTPGRVYKGRKMPGHMGNRRVTQKNLEVAEIELPKNLMLLKGAVPGKDGSFLMIRKAG